MILEGKNINLCTVTVKDTDFIFTMRQNQKKTKYLSKVTGSIESQKVWIENYKEREREKKEFYFVIESKDNEKFGLVRMYDFINDSFCWGSWLIKDGAPKTTAIESSLRIYEFGFYSLGFEKLHFDVRKGNEKVIAFHERFGAKIVDEDQMNFYFYFDKQTYEITKQKYKRFL